MLYNRSRRVRIDLDLADADHHLHTANHHHKIYIVWSSMLEIEIIARRSRRMLAKFRQYKRDDRLVCADEEIE